MIATLSSLWHAAATGMALDAPLLRLHRPSRQRTSTGGPNDDDDENERLKKLMPILAVVIVLAVVFGQ